MGRVTTAFGDDRENNEIVASRAHAVRLKIISHYNIMRKTILTCALFHRNAEEAQIDGNKVKGLIEFLRYFEYKISGVAEEKMVSAINFNRVSSTAYNNTI